MQTIRKAPQTANDMQVSFGVDGHIADMLRRKSLNVNPPGNSLEQVEVRTVGSLWRRTVAFLLDCLVLYAVGRSVGSIFFDTISRLGPLGRLIGFLSSSRILLYTGISHRGWPDFLSKRLLRLRVVDDQGASISWRRSAVRFTVFAIPYFLIVPSSFCGDYSWDSCLSAHIYKYRNWWHYDLSPRLQPPYKAGAPRLCRAGLLW